MSRKNAYAQKLARQRKQLALINRSSAATISAMLSIIAINHCYNIGKKRAIPFIDEYNRLDAELYRDPELGAERMALELQRIGFADKADILYELATGKKGNFKTLEDKNVNKANQNKP